LLILAVAALVRPRASMFFWSGGRPRAARIRVLAWIVGCGDERAALEQQARQIG